MKVLRWRIPADADEAAERFLLIEDRGDRVLVGAVALVGWPIPPTFCYKKADLIAEG